MQQTSSILTPQQKRKHYRKENQRRMENAVRGQSVMLFINNQWRIAVKH